MMNPIEKLRQIQIDQRLIAGLQMLRCLSDRSVSAPTRTEAMAAVMESRLEDRLQNLEHGLLSRPVHYIRDAKPGVDSGARCNGFMKTEFGRLCQAL